MSRQRVALTVAGSDSGGGAGVQADLKVFASEGVWGVCALTAVTAQDTVGVSDVVPMAPEVVAAQIRAVATDMEISAAKTGMLCNASTVEVVAEQLAGARIAKLVVDPVAASTSGSVLLDPDGLRALVELLLPLCSVLTPNLAEAEMILGGPVQGTDGMLSAARELAGMGPSAVLLKGGHLAAEDPAGSPDLLWSGGEAHWLPGRRVPGGGAHGTGCVLSASVAARLAVGDSLESACRRAKALVGEALTRPVKLGRGQAVLWPGERPDKL